LSRMIHIKAGASLAGLKLEMRPALVAADSIWGKHGKELWVTCGTDGEHSAGSLHYYGYALDLRTTYFGMAEAKVVRDKLAEALGEDYDVILHANHIHVEYQFILDNPELGVVFKDVPNDRRNRENQGRQNTQTAA
jgi:hypothetical protein